MQTLRQLSEELATHSGTPILLDPYDHRLFDEEAMTMGGVILVTDPEYGEFTHLSRLVYGNVEVGEVVIQKNVGTDYSYSNLKVERPHLRASGHSRWPRGVSELKNHNFSARGRHPQTGQRVYLGYTYEASEAADIVRMFETAVYGDDLSNVTEFRAESKSNAMTPVQKDRRRRRSALGKFVDSIGDASPDTLVGELRELLPADVLDALVKKLTEKGGGA